MRTYEEISNDAPRERAFSNMSEYEVWASNGKGCFDCRHDDEDPGCPILGVALLGGWPKEWTRETHTWEAPNGERGGSYEVVEACIEFEERRDDGRGEPTPEPDPDPVIEGQLDLIDAYLDTAISELTSAPEVAAR